MKRWTAGVCVAFLAGCAGPQISVTEASARRVGFLVQNSWLVPMQDVDEQAAGYCRRHGLTYRRTEAVLIGPALKRVAYECGFAEQPQTPKLEVRRTPTATPKPKMASDDPRWRRGQRRRLRQTHGRFACDLMPSEGQKKQQKSRWWLPRRS